MSQTRAVHATAPGGDCTAGKGSHRAVPPDPLARHARRAATAAARRHFDQVGEEYRVAA